MKAEKHYNYMNARFVEINGNKRKNKYRLDLRLPE